jgi:hypothetical protein
MGKGRGKQRWGGVSHLPLRNGEDEDDLGREHPACGLFSADRVPIVLVLRPSSSSSVRDQADCQDGRLISAAPATNGSKEIDIKFVVYPPGLHANLSTELAEVLIKLWLY